MSDPVADSYAYCKVLAKRTARNFYYSFLTLPRARLEAMCVLYAFMRVTDDLGDNDRPERVRAADLAHWREGLLAAFDTGVCEHPVLPALVEVVRRYGVPVRHLFEVIEGVEMDLRPVAYESFEQLARYCYHVAGAVGLACVHLWGFHDERALSAAVDCGTAFQLTNILRDVREDAAQGRVYLPGEDLARFGLTASDLGRCGRDERFKALMRFEVERAREYYERARPLYGFLDAPGKPILDAMFRIYGGLLDEIERRGYDVFSRRIELSRWRKLCMTAQTVARHKLRTLFAR